MNMLLHTFEVTAEHRGILERIRGFGYDGVELPILGGVASSYAETGKMLDDIGLERTAVTICTAATNPVSPKPEVRAAGVAWLKLVVDCADAAGARILCGPMHSALGEFTGAGPTDQEMQWCHDCLLEVADHAKTKGVVLALEALNRFECYMFTDVGSGAAFTRRINHPNLRSMYDSFHANIEESSIDVAMTSAWDQVSHVHISENNRATPGEGLVDWDATFRMLKTLNYDGWLTVEAFGFAIPQIAAATKIWRQMFPNPAYLEEHAIDFIERNMGIAH